jgi:hypothetical protein
MQVACDGGNHVKSARFRQELRGYFCRGSLSRDAQGILPSGRDAPGGRSELASCARPDGRARLSPREPWPSPGNDCDFQLLANPKG